MEVILDGYWDKRPPDHIKAMILADWCDRLQDWTQEQILFALRSWQDSNPNKRCNPGHIKFLLEGMRGAAELRRNPPRPAEPPFSAVVDRQKAREAQDAIIETATNLRHVEGGA